MTQLCNKGRSPAAQSALFKYHSAAWRPELKHWPVSGCLRVSASSRSCLHISCYVFRYFLTKYWNVPLSQLILREQREQRNMSVDPESDSDHRNIYIVTLDGSAGSAARVFLGPKSSWSQSPAVSARQSESHLYLHFTSKRIKGLLKKIEDREKMLEEKPP